MRPFQESDRFDYAFDATSVIIDLGGYEGWFSDQAFKKWGCHVFCYEPVPTFYDAIAKRFANTPPVRVFDTFVTAKRGDVVEIGIKGDMSGRFTAGANSNVRAHSEGIRDVVMGAIFETGRRPDLIKMNVEGAEFEILEEMLRDDLVPMVRHFQIQPHGNVPDAEKRWAAIQEGLSKTHAQTFCSPFCWEGWSLKT